MPNLEYQEYPFDEFLYGLDWKEAVDGEQAPSGSGALSLSDQTATLVGYVPFRKFRSAARYFLGHSSCDAGSPYRLYREPPAHFTHLPQLKCYSVGFQPRILKANPDGTRSLGAYGGVVFGEVAHVPNDDTPWLDWLGNPVRAATYEEMVLTLGFRSFGRVNFADDTRIVTYRDEVNRYTKWSVDPQTEVLAADNAAQLLFDEGEPSTAGLGGARLPFPVAVAEIMSKAGYSLTWFNVPFDYVSSNSTYLYPRKIIERLGTANEAEFCGHPKGTLLLTAVKIEEVLFPVAPELPDYPLTGFSFTFLFEQFDPKKGVPASEWRGHLTFIWRKTGLWYHAVRQNGNEYVPLTDFYKLFQHQADSS